MKEERISLVWSG